MEIYLHNTQTGRKERFEPLIAGEVSVYVCGPTVYGFVHIGNGVPAVAFDVLVRLLRSVYPKVKYVRNITDVDDKINAAAVRLGQPISALAEGYAAEYLKDVAALGVAQPDVEPRATGHVSAIVAMIENLIERGHAYEAAGHVLFHVPSDPEYGTLSKRSLDEMRDGARVEVAPYKRDPKDFGALETLHGRPARLGQPLGPRPTRLAHRVLRDDSRAPRHRNRHSRWRGSDLVFPHHENESAQSRCVNGGTASVRYCCTTACSPMGDAKMSKSVGNIVTIRSLLEDHDGETLRYALLSGQYRQSLAWERCAARSSQGQPRHALSGAARQRRWQWRNGHGL